MIMYLYAKSSDYNDWIDSLYEREMQCGLRGDGSQLPVQMRCLEAHLQNLLSAQ